MVSHLKQKDCFVFIDPIHTRYKSFSLSFYLPFTCMQFSTKEIDNYSRNNFIWGIKCETTPSSTWRLHRRSLTLQGRLDWYFHIFFVRSEKRLWCFSVSSTNSATYYLVSLAVTSVEDLIPRIQPDIPFSPTHLHQCRVCFALKD